MELDYSKLISEKRNRVSSMTSEKRTPDQESESDRGRIIFSSPFRRLQQKAQVYSLEDNAAVRSRLTHSLEVAQTGRWIAQLILGELRTKQQLPNLGLQNKEIAFLNFVETACLIHDLGNPPFGHLGEFALQQWFSIEGEKCIESALGISKEKLSPAESAQLAKLLRDFTEFDGNCQGLRIVAKLQWMKDPDGLNLTYTQILSYLKYVVHASEIDANDERKKKGGYFLTEQDLVIAAWDALGMAPNSRHPLVYIMEAADDIAYSISDIEDAIEKGLIRFEDFLNYLEKSIDFSNLPDSGGRTKLKQAIETGKQNCATTGLNLSPYTQFRTTVTTELTKFAAQRYVEEHEKILKGTAQPIFSKDSEQTNIEARFVLVVKEFALASIYPSPAASNNELAGYTVLRGLLDHYRPLLSCHADTFRKLIDPSATVDLNRKPNKLQRRLFDRLPIKYRKVYDAQIGRRETNSNVASALTEWHHRTHLITDYLSGMTDDFALETYQLLSGIQVGKPI